MANYISQTVKDFSKTVGILLVTPFFCFCLIHSILYSSYYAWINLNLGFDFELAGNDTVIQVHQGKMKWGGKWYIISVQTGGKKGGWRGGGFVGGHLCSRITKAVILS